MLVTAAEIYAYVRFGINKGNAGTLTPVEFDVLYNAASLEFVQSRSAVAESNQRIRDDLRALIPPLTEVPNTGGGSGGTEQFVLPGDPLRYLHALSVAFLVMGTDCGKQGRWAGGRPLRRDYRHEGGRNPFHRGTAHRPRYWMTGDVVMVDCGAGNSASRMRLEYIRWPGRVSVVNGLDPDLPPEVNQKVADFAVRKHLENIESQRYRTNLHEQQLNP